ncbi:hypothetical protein STHU_41730 [Allostella humosa]|nr:invasion associated locus B family protein [Stella humosa]BBK33539.1 hypothetical protein STHU_41730 [Stella humosa]
MHARCLSAALLALFAAGALVPAAAQQKDAQQKNGRPAAASAKAKPKPAAAQKGKPAKAPAAAAGAAAAGAGAGAAAAGASAAAFDDWRLGCEKRPGVAKETCFVEQRLSHKDQPDRLVLAVAVGYFAADGKPAMIMKLPPTAIKDAGIIIQVDQRPLREVGIRSCGADNCSVLALLDDDMLGELRGGKEAVIAYSRQDTDGITRIPMSLRGLTKGLAALRNRQG